jgi:hypothetical protein
MGKYDLMYETPQGLYGTVWHPLGHGEFYDFILTENSEPITIEFTVPLAIELQALIVDQSGPNLWTII